MTTTTMSDMMDAIQVAEQVEAGTMSPGVARVALLVGGCGGDVLDEIAALAPDRTKAEWLFGKAPAPEVTEAQVLHGCRMATVLIRSDDPRGEMGTRIPLECHDPGDLEGLQRAGCEAIYQGLRQLSAGAGPEHAEDRPAPASTGNWVWNPDAQWMPDPDRDSELARRATAILRIARLEGLGPAFIAAEHWIEEEVTDTPDRRVEAQIAALPGGLDLDLAREDTECPESFLSRAKGAARAGDLVTAGQLLRRSMARQEVLETAEATPAPSSPRSIPTHLVDSMRQRCGLDPDFPGAMANLVADEDQTARGTGRTTEMLLHALVAYDEGRPVVIVGPAGLLQPAWAELFRASGVCERPPPVRFIGWRGRVAVREKMRDVNRKAAIFVDHAAAHRMVERALGPGMVVVDVGYRVAAGQRAPVELRARPEPQPLLTLHIGPDHHPDRDRAVCQFPTRLTHLTHAMAGGTTSVNTHSTQIVDRVGLMVARGDLQADRVQVRWYQAGTVGDASFNAAGVLIGAPVGILAP